MFNLHFGALGKFLYHFVNGIRRNVGESSVKIVDNLLDEAWGEHVSFILFSVVQEVNSWVHVSLMYATLILLVEEYSAVDKDLRNG